MVVRRERLGSRKKKKERERRGRGKEKKNDGEVCHSPTTKKKGVAQSGEKRRRKEREGKVPE